MAKRDFFIENVKIVVNKFERNFYMYNDSVIQEQSGLNAFYNKIYSLVGIGVGISALCLA